MARDGKIHTISQLRKKLFLKPKPAVPPGLAAKAQAKAKAKLNVRQERALANYVPVNKEVFAKANLAEQRFAATAPRPTASNQSATAR